MENYIMTAIETDVQFVDNASDTHMSDEEREYWIDLEESYDEEENESCGDATIDNLFDSYSGDKTSETDRVEDIKKAKQVVIPTYKGVVSRIEENTNRLADHFNHQGVK